MCQRRFIAGAEEYQQADGQSCHVAAAAVAVVVVGTSEVLSAVAKEPFHQATKNKEMLFCNL